MEEDQEERFSDAAGMSSQAARKWHGPGTPADAVRLRQGRRVSKTIYVQQGEQPADSDPLVGYIEDGQLAGQIVRVFNAAQAGQEIARKAAMRALADDAGPDTPPGQITGTR